MGSIYIPKGGGGSPPFALDNNGQLAYCTTTENANESMGFTFDANGWPFISPSGNQYFGFDSNANPTINNGRYPVMGLDGDGNPNLYNHSGAPVLGFDGGESLYLSGPWSTMSIYNGCNINDGCYINNGCNIYSGLNADYVYTGTVNTSSCFAYGFTVDGGNVNISTGNMATSDPGVSGQVWRDGNTLMISI